MTTLTPWDKVQLARHPQRPHTLDYVRALCEDFVELHGDRRFGEDPAVVGGLARFDGQTVMIVGHQKGKDTRENVRRNFGMPRPEGYRKALRLFQHAEKFGMPLLCFIDTPGADPSMESEERGQAEAIAENIMVMAGLRVPIIATVIGEGGSGGAIALATADRVLMLEHSIYSVISPEGCASILWRSAEQNQEAAEALRLTAQDLEKLGVIDGIVPEPLGAAHRGREQTISAVGDAIEAALEELCRIDGGALKVQRREKFLAMGEKGLG